MRTNATTASRLTTVGAAVVLAFLLIFVAWSASATKRRSEALSAATVKSGAYLDAVDSMSLEHDIVDGTLVAMLSPGQTADPTVRREHSQAGRALEATLREIRAHPDVGRGEVGSINAILDRHAAYRLVAGRFFDAAISGERRAAVAINLAEVDPLLDPVAEELRTTALQERREAAHDQAALEQANRLGLTATAIVFAVAVALLGAFTALALRFRRRLEQARGSELAHAQHAALTDSLTGLRNNRAFHEDVVRELHRSVRTGQPLALVLLDLDGLKQTNDTLGHQAGDELIKALAVTVVGTQRAADAAYRVGGDEFAVLLPGETAWGAYRFIGRLQRRLAEEAGASATAGIAEASALDIDKDYLIRRADVALISAKRTRRSALIHSDELEAAPVPGARAAHRHHLETLATALARAVDAKDSYTRSHCETVSELCVLIAGELGLEPDHTNRLRLAGLLHDAGKIGIADAILRKPAPLTDDEFEVMKTHAALGARIVAGAELEEESNWILHHHERPDGRGYPDGLAGDAIPRESRMILVADAFEAMTSDRPYRAGRPEQEALAELERCAGTQFDPECVAALRRALTACPTGAPTPASAAARTPAPIS